MDDFNIEINIEAGQKIIANVVQLSTGKTVSLAIDDLQVAMGAYKAIMDLATTLGALIKKD